MDVKYIVIHCSDSPQGRGDNAEAIHRWHRERGWSGIGYHFVVLEDGTVENGRPVYWPGAHVMHHNTDTVGICLIGKNEFTASQTESLGWTIVELLDKFPDAEVKGHCDLDRKKTCPNFDVGTWWDEWRLANN